MSRHLETDRASTETHGVTCVWVDDHLEAYLEGEVEATAGQHIAQHLEACPRCQRAHALAQRIAVGLRALPSPTCPPGVTDAVIAEVNRGVSHTSAHAPNSAVANIGASAPATPSSTPDVDDMGTGATVLPMRRPALARFWPAAVAALLVIAVGLGARTPTTRAPAAAEVAQAEAEVKLALAYLGQMGRQTGHVMGDEVLEQRLVRPMASSIRGLFAPAPEEGS